MTMVGWPAKNKELKRTSSRHPATRPFWNCRPGKGFLSRTEATKRIGAALEALLPGASPPRCLAHPCQERSNLHNPKPLVLSGRVSGCPDQSGLSSPCG